MSILNNSLLLGADAGGGGGGYQISRSLRFNAPDSSFLSRTPASAGNRKTWTWAGWVKRSALTSARNFLFGCGPNGNDFFGVEFSDSSDALTIQHYAGGTQYLARTTQVFRDASAWYHLVLAIDTSQAVNTNRVKVYVNGVQVTAFSTYSTWPQNLDTNYNRAETTLIGNLTTDFSGYFNGYLADIHFIDGQALDPTSFGEFDANGIWQPKAYSGTYGTNGFRLDFADNASTTTIGYDAAGSNDWTANNLSVTAGSGNDSLVDSPTSYGTDTGVGGEVRGNYCTWNPLDQSGITPSNGNLDSTGNGICRATFAMSSGKWYWEQTVVTKLDGANNPRAGVSAVGSSLTNDLGEASNQWVMFMAGGSNGGKGYNASTITGSGSAFSVNDVAMFAYDADAGKLWFGRNGTWITGDPAAGTTPFYSSVTAPVFPTVQEGSSSSVLNTGARSFAYTAPSGYKALNTANLPAPLVTKPSDLFDVKLWTGNGAARSITGLGFSPDLVWIKARSTSSYRNALFDIVRGANNRLISDLTNAEDTGAGIGVVSAFNSDGFSLDGGGGSVNETSQTYVAWAWDAGSSTVTNTAGTIQSTVRANASAGFSVVTYTGNGTQNATVGHGLGVSPRLHILKNRSSSSNWVVLTTQIDGSLDFAYLNSTAAFGNAAQNSPSSTVFSVWNDTDSNTNGSNYVAYCFAPVASYSAMGSYVGNGSADGPFVYTGFRPRYVLIKRTDTTNYWIIQDGVRNAYNVVDLKLAANTANAENDVGTIGDTSQNTLDFLSNGFKCRTSNAGTNTSSGTYVYAAFAENPFALARAR